MPINVIDTIKPKNNGTFPIVEAEDVKINNDTRLPEALESKYEKPQEGIPASDLTQSVQNSLGLADTALQSNDLNNYTTNPIQITSGTNITLQDNAEYRLQNVTSLNLSYPNGNFECWMKIETAQTGEIQIDFPQTTTFVGKTPTFGNEEIWEILIKDKVVIAKNINEIIPEQENISNKVTSWSITPNNEHYPSEKLVKDTINTKQNTIDSNNKLSSDLVDDTNKTNKFVTTADKTAWTAKYDKPNEGIPSTDLTSDIQTIITKIKTGSHLSTLSIGNELNVLDGYEYKIPAVRQLTVNIPKLEENETLDCRILLKTINIDEIYVRFYIDDNGSLSNPIYINTAPTIGKNEIWEILIHNNQVQGFKLGSYTLPTTGIPIEDLASGIQASLSLADTAIQPEDLSNVATSGSYTDLSNKPTIPDVSDFISKNVNDLTYYYTKDEINSMVSSVYVYKGTVSTYATLPNSNLTIGDVYNVETDGSNYAWTGTEWDKLGGDIDLSNYAMKPVQVTNGTDITLQDNAEYRLTNVSNLNVSFPGSNFECWMRITTASEGSIEITFPISSKFMQGDVPVISNSETWEFSIKDGYILYMMVME